MQKIEQWCIMQIVACLSELHTDTLSVNMQEIEHWCIMQIVACLSELHTDTLECKHAGDRTVVYNANSCMSK